MLKNKCLYCLVVLGVLFTATSGASAALVTYNWDVKVGDTLKVTCEVSCGGMACSMRARDITSSKDLPGGFADEICSNKGLFTAKGDDTFTVVGNPGTYVFTKETEAASLKYNINIIGN